MLIPLFGQNSLGAYPVPGIILGAGHRKIRIWTRYFNSWTFNSSSKSGIKFGGREKAGGVLLDTMSHEVCGRLSR